MKKAISIFTVMCILLISAFSTCLYSDASEMLINIDFQNAEPIDSGVIYRTSVEGNGDFVLCRFTAPEDGYYLFEALGEKYEEKAFYEPVATLYDSNQIEIQYVEFDFYDPKAKGNAPYAKMVQQLKKGETCYYKTTFLNPEISGTYSIRVIEAPDLVFTYLPLDEYTGIYELFRYAGTSKEFTLNGSYAVSKDESLYTPIKKAPLNTIGLGAFEGNEYLENITLSYDINCIASEAFLNCKNLKSANLGKNIYTIGYRAFAGCDSLKSITIDYDYAVLEPQCLGFDENGNKYSDFTIICNENSNAEKYAQANGINYILSKFEPITTDSSVTSNSTSTKASVTSDYDNTSSNYNQDKIVKKPKVKKATIKKVNKISKKSSLRLHGRK